jgi:hypothetical protein
MGEAEQFDGRDVGLEENNRRMPGRNGAGHPDAKPAQTLREVAPRTVGSPLPMGSTGRSPLPIGLGDSPSSRTSAPPPGRALSMTGQTDVDQSSGMQWAMGMMKQAVPFVQRLLPLLDGQIGTAVANLLASRPHPPAPRVDLEPIEHRLSELQLQQHDLKDQLVDQNASLKRVEDHLEMVREATDRNTLEQQELIEDLKAMGSRVNLFALSFLVLLLLSILLNIALFLHISRVLP